MDTGSMSGMRGTSGRTSHLAGSMDGEKDSTVVSWLMSDAKGKLQEAVTKLNLDSSKINGKHLPSLGIEDLLNEKKKVKNELKYYDQAFMTRF